MGDSVAEGCKELHGRCAGGGRGHGFVGVRMWRACMVKETAGGCEETFMATWGQEA